MSQFAQLLLTGVLKGVQCMLLKAFLALTLADLSFLYGAKGEVSCSSAESLGVGLFLTSWGQMKAWSDLCLSLLLGVDSSELGSTEVLLDGKDVRGDHEGDLGE